MSAIGKFIPKSGAECRFKTLAQVFDRGTETPHLPAAPSPSMQVINRHVFTDKPPPWIKFRSPSEALFAPRLRTIVLPTDRPPLNNRCIEQNNAEEYVLFITAAKPAHYLVLSLFFVGKARIK